MKKYSLQLRLTVAVGLILLAVCALLTINSLFSANTYYGDYAKLMEDGLIEYDSALTESESSLYTQQQEYSQEFYNEASQKFSLQSILAMAVIVIVALAVTYVATGRMLRPMKDLTDFAQAVDEHNMDQRMPLDKTGGEVLVLAEAYNRMLDRLQEAFLIQKSFASNAAHELKTPLAVIKSSLQVLEINPSPQIEDYKEFMSDTGQSLERIIKTVDGLLTLANPAAADTDSPVALVPVAEQAVHELSARAMAGQVSVTIIGDTSLTVYGNYSLLYRAVFNLIENAIKYNRPGGTVSITLKADGDKALVIVADSGIGMEPAVLSHIFEPFYRADPSRSQKIPGSGLGLAVVKMILERHGGTIKAESEPGAGSVFTVCLGLTETSKV